MTDLIRATRMELFKLRRTLALWSALLVPLAVLARSFAFVPAALLMVSVQTWVATRWRSFTAAMGLGIAASVIGIMLLRSLAGHAHARATIPRTARVWARDQSC